MIDLTIFVILLNTLLYKIITYVVTQEYRHSNASIETPKVAATYTHAGRPLFPELPGLGFISPSTISSTNVVQLGSTK